MKSDTAERRIAAYMRQRGEAHLVLAWHCAVPLALTPDLAYRLWANFQRDVQGQPLRIPWVAVADLLLSRLCEEAGDELYEMDGTIRQQLLGQLETDPRFGPQRIGEVAEFLLQYVKQQVHSEDLDTRDFALAQEWSALAYTRPEAAAHELALALTAVDRQDRSELLRISSVVDTLAKPLESFGSLLAYADALRSFARGDEPAAAARIGTLVDEDRQIHIAGAAMSIPHDLLPPSTKRPPRPAGKRPAHTVRQRWALLVGIDRYDDPALPSLSSAGGDALALQRTLNGLDVTTIVLHNDAKEANLLPTVANISAELGRLVLAAQPGDLLFFFFFGHMLADASGSVIVAQDTRLSTPATMITARAIERMLRISGVLGVVIILYDPDSPPRLDRPAPDIPELSRRPQARESPALLVTATGGRQGLFVDHLRVGLAGDADRNDKGYITASDLADYLQRRLGPELQRDSGALDITWNSSDDGDIPLVEDSERTGAADLIQGTSPLPAEAVPGPTTEIPDAAAQLGRHSAPITALATLPDGRLASASDDGQLQLWNAERRPSGAAGFRPGEELGRHSAPITALATLPDGRLASASDDGQLQLWNAERRPSGAAGFRPGEELGRHSAPITALATLPDGRLASASDDGQLQLWNAERRPSGAAGFRPGEELGRHSAPITALATLPDGRLASASDDGQLQLWDPASPGTAAQLGRHSAPITALATLPDGRLASASDDGQLQLWDPASPGTAAQLGRHSAPITALATLPDGRLASASDDGQLQLWDPASPGTAAQLGRHSAPITALATLPDGRLASASDDGQLQLWDPAHVSSGTAELAAQDPEPGPGPAGLLQRYLVAHLPERVREGSEAILVVEVSAGVPAAAAGVVSVGLDLEVEDGGTVVTVQVQMPARLAPRDELGQDLHIPMTEGSESVGFRFRARESGRQRVLITAWAGGTYLAELSLKLTVEGEPATAALASAASADDVPADVRAVMLQIRSSRSDSTFQLLSERYLGEPVLAPAAVDPNQAVGRLMEQLRAEASGRYPAAFSRRLIEQIGVQLWTDLVPQPIQEEFWQLQNSISSFIIADDRGLVPWELLYPRAPDHDEGFLVEQFPVMRLVLGQRQSRRITIGGTTFVVSPEAPPSTQDEIAAIQRILGRGRADTPTVSDLGTLLELISSGEARSLYFTGHSAAGRSREAAIAMEGGPLTPTFLNQAVAQRALADRHPLVFVNMCRDAGELPEYTQMMGWAKQFMTAGAGAFIGTSWTVPSNSVRTFAEELYGALADGQPLGEAVHRARLRVREDSSDPSWLAYMAYGDPTALAEPLPEEPERTGSVARATAPSNRTARRRADTARVVAVHGLGQQWLGPEILRTMWLPALQDGLARAGAEPLASDDLAVAFYADLFQTTSSASAGEDAQEDLEHPDERFEQELLVPLSRAAATVEGTPEPEATSRAGRKSVAQSALRTLSSSRFFSGLSTRALMGDLRQLWSYLQEPAIRQAAQARIADVVGPETRVVLAHSIGSIVAYETLCAHPEWDIHMFVTLGSPLGVGAIFDRLNPAPEDGIGSWPRSIRQWTNVVDRADTIATVLAPEFAGRVMDVTVDNGARAHDPSRYLAAVATGIALAEGLAD